MYRHFSIRVYAIVLLLVTVESILLNARAFLVVRHRRVEAHEAGLMVLLLLLNNLLVVHLLNVLGRLT